MIGPLRCERGLVWVLLLLAACVARGQTPKATPPPPGPPRSLTLPVPVERRLPNGLRVVVIRRANSPLVTVDVIINKGAEVDPAGLAGLAHMTASLLTLGTTTRSATQIAEGVEALGGSQSSEAMWDASMASVEVMSDKVDPAMRILADVVQHPMFASDEINRLRQQELDALNVELGEPASIATLAGARVLYGTSSYGHPMGGTPESLKRIRRADIVNFHRALYQPQNAILIVGGDISAETALLLAKKYFGSWTKAPTASMIKSPPNPEPGNKRRVVVIDKPDAGQAAVLLLCKSISRRDSSYFPALVTNSVLDGYSGKLNQEIRVKRGLSYGAGSYLEARRAIGPFVASAQTRNDAAAEVAGLLIQEVSALSTSTISSADLIPRKAVLTGAFGRELEEINGLVSDLGFLAVMDLPLDEPNRFVNNVEAVTPQNIREFASKHLNTSEASVIIVGNAKQFLPELRRSFNNIEVIPIKELDLNNDTMRKTSGILTRRRQKK